MSDRIQWTGVEQVQNNMRLYGHRAKQAVRAVADYWAVVIEAYAIDNARWQDQTGNARQGLYTVVDDLANDTVVLYLSHGEDYGVYLELKYQGTYAIILEALQEHYDDILDMLREIFE